MRYSADSPGKSLTLLVPGLFGFPARSTLAPAEAAPRAPYLETCLARAVRLPGQSGDYEAQVFALFGIEAAADADLPVAAVTRALDLGVIDKGWWLRADPVHLRDDRDRLILFDTRAVVRNACASPLAPQPGRSATAAKALRQPRCERAKR